MNELILNDGIMPRLLDCDFMVAPAPFVHMDRTADFHVMIYVTEGVIYVTEDGTDYDINTGELFFLKSHVHHYGQREIPKGTKWFYAHFTMNSSSAANSQAVISAPLIEHCISVPKKLSILGDSNLERRIVELADCFHSPRPQSQWLANSKLFELLTETAFYEQTHLTAPSLSDRICTYLSDHYTQGFSAAALEKHFFLSYKYMAAVFKKEKQFTMQQYHTQVRMNAACKLLKTTDLSIGQISELVGYSDMLYFSRCFHRALGCSPTEYRRNLPLSC